LAGANFEIVDGLREADKTGVGQRIDGVCDGAVGRRRGGQGDQKRTAGDQCH
jgi:hypothetical protein